MIHLHKFAHPREVMVLILAALRKSVPNMRKRTIKSESSKYSQGKRARARMYMDRNPEIETDLWRRAKDSLDLPHTEGSKMQRHQWRADIQDYRANETQAIRFKSDDEFDDAMEHMYRSDLRWIPHSFIGGRVCRVPKDAIPIFQEFYNSLGMEFSLDDVFSAGNLTGEQYAMLQGLKQNPRHTSEP